jgi:hypothetical protein
MDLVTVLQNAQNPSKDDACLLKLLELLDIKMTFSMLHFESLGWITIDIIFSPRVMLRICQ